MGNLCDNQGNNNARVAVDSVESRFIIIKVRTEDDLNLYSEAESDIIGLHDSPYSMYVREFLRIIESN